MSVDCTICGHHLSRHLNATSCAGLQSQQSCDCPGFTRGLDDVCRCGHARAVHTRVGLAGIGTSCAADGCECARFILETRCVDCGEDMATGYVPAGGYPKRCGHCASFEEGERAGERAGAERMAAALWAAAARAEKAEAALAESEHLRAETSSAANFYCDAANLNARELAEARSQIELAMHWGAVVVETDTYLLSCIEENHAGDELWYARRIAELAGLALSLCRECPEPLVRQRALDLLERLAPEALADLTEAQRERLRGREVPVSGEDAFEAWRKWFAANVSGWNGVTDVEGALRDEPDRAAKADRIFAIARAARTPAEIRAALETIAREVRT